LVITSVDENTMILDIQLQFQFKNSELRCITMRNC